MQIGVDSNLAVEGKRVFVVDTDEITRMAAVFMLHDEYETHELGELDAAYRKAVDWKPDLLVLGAGLLEAQGPALPDEIKARIAGVKLLLLAEAGTEEAVQRWRQAGVDGAVFKPLTVEKLRDRAAALLGRRKPIVIHAI